MPKTSPGLIIREIHKLYDEGYCIDEIADHIKLPYDTVCRHVTYSAICKRIVKKQETESTTLEDRLDYTNPKSEETKKQGIDAVTEGKGKGSVGTLYLHMLNQLKKLGLTPSQYLDQIAKQRGYQSAKELKEAMAAKKGCKPEELSDFIAREHNYNSLAHVLNHLAKYLGFHSQQHYADCTMHEKGEGSVVEHVEDFLEELTSKNGEKLEELLKEKGFEDFGGYVDYLSKITGYDLPKHLPKII